MSQNTMELILSHFTRSTHIPISCFCEKELILRTSPNIDFNLPLFLINSLSSPFPPLWYCITPEHMYFAGLYEKKTHQLIMLGPSLHFSCTEKQAENILTKIGRTKKDVPILQQFFNNSASCSLLELKEHLLFLNYLINGISLSSHDSIQTVEFHWKEIIAPILNDKSEEETTGSPDEAELLKYYLQTGQVKQMRQYIHEKVYRKDSEIIKNTSTNLTIQRAYIFGANMVASQAAVSAGLSQKKADTLAMKYIQEIISAKTVTDLSHIFLQFYEAYTVAVSKVKRSDSASPSVIKIQSYINEHLYEKITPTILSDKLHMNCSYLCTHFKNETGKTLSIFIQECKIDEACMLLKTKSLTQFEVSSLLSFSSQSYFCRVFKKIKGVSPTEYLQQF